MSLRNLPSSRSSIENWLCQSLIALTLRLLQAPLQNSAQESGDGSTLMKSMIKSMLMLATAGLLFGCATGAQRQLAGMAANSRSASQEFQNCATAIYNQPELEPLRRNLPLSPENASLAQLANTNHVSPEEAQLILANHPKLQACRQQFISQLSQATPTLAPIFVKAVTATDDSTVALLQKKLRWGEFLQRVRQITLERRAETEAEGRRVLAGLEQAHEAEVARRQAAIQALSNAMIAYGQTQQAIAGMNRSINCTAMSLPRPVSTAPGITTINCN